jgi:hypothetical protein
MDRLIELVYEKNQLSLLWTKLNEVVSLLTPVDRAWLYKYASLRVGVRNLRADERRAIRRVVARFSRRVDVNISLFGGAIAAVNKYWCLLR